MSRHTLISYVVIALVLLVAFLIIQQPNQATITGGAIITGEQIVNESQVIEPEELKMLSPQDIIYFAKNFTQDNFEESKGVFIKGKEEMECIGNSTAECEIWIYPYEGLIREKPYSFIYDFGENDAPSLDQLFEEDDPDLEVREFSNGRVIIQEIDKTERFIRFHKFEVNFICQERYWVVVGFSQWREGILEEKGQILDIADRMLDNCQTIG